MHSSGMRTARLLTVSQHALWPEGVPAQGVPAGGGYLPGGYLPEREGVYLPGGVPARGSTCPGTPPWTDRHL